MKICVISGDVGSNAFGRAWILVKALQIRHQVLMAGVDWGKEVWPVADLKGIKLKTVKGAMWPRFFSVMEEMVSLIEGDIIYAVKPKMSSFGLGLKARRRLNAPLILDIDDDETAFTESVWHCWKPNSLRDPNAYLATRLMESMIGRADGLTVISESYREKYGRGVIMPHGRDTNFLDPEKYDRAEEKRKRGYEGFKFAVFAGTPRPHKGLEDILMAMKIIDREDFKLLVVGALESSPFTTELRRIGGESLITVPPRPFSELPGWLALADIVALPSAAGKRSEGQVPAKLIDAMAMGRPIVAADVGQMKQTAGEAALYVPPGDVKALAETMNRLLKDEDYAAELGRKARAKCLAEFSLKVMSDRFEELFCSLLDRA